MSKMRHSENSLDAFMMTTVVVSVVAVDEEAEQLALS